jgi:hypothetical protein
MEMHSWSTLGGSSRHNSYILWTFVPWVQDSWSWKGVGYLVQQIMHGSGLQLFTIACDQGICWIAEGLHFKVFVPLHGDDRNNAHAF